MVHETARQAREGDSRFVLIVGADGTLGIALAESLAADGIPVRETTRRGGNGAGRIFLDLAAHPDSWSLPAQGMASAFLCAASASVEQCRIDPTGTRRVNVVATGELARRLTAQGAFVVFLSTNLVFDGTTIALPSQPPSPVTEYGRQKADAEKQLLALGENIAIVRLGKVVGPHLPLLDGWMRDLRAGKPIHPFGDMRLAPITVDFAVNVLREVANRRATGVIHASSAGDITYSDAARLIALKLGADEKLVQPISARDANIEHLPLHTALEGNTMERLGIAQPLPTAAFDWVTGAGAS